MSQWQYLGHVEPVLPVPRAGDLPAQFAPALPDLPPRRIGLPTALLLAASVLVTAPAAAAAPFDWHQPLSEPIAVRRAVQYDTGAEAPNRVARPVALGWETPLSQPSVRPPLILDTTVAPVHVPAVTVTLAWATPLSEPTWRAHPLSFDTGAEAPLPIAASLAWAAPQAEPRRATAHVQHDTGAAAPLTVPTRITWTLQDVDQPSRQRARVIAHETGAERPLEVPPAAVVNLDWYVPLAEPVRRIVEPTPGTGAHSPTMSIAVTVFDPPLAVAAVDVSVNVPSASGHWVSAPSARDVRVSTSSATGLIVTVEDASLGGGIP